MIEFLQHYGLWLVLAGVFFAMHRFGTGCCGRKHYRLERRENLLPDDNVKSDMAAEPLSKPNESCH